MESGLDEPKWYWSTMAINPMYMTMPCKNALTRTVLDPFELIFKTFVNPKLASYVWVGLDQCEVAYLNNFRYSKG